MRIAAGWLCCLVGSLCGCADHQRADAIEAAKSPYPQRDVAWPQEWAAALGQTLTLDGVAENWKLGAFLSSPGNGGVWIADFREWPTQCFDGAKGKKVRVTGTVVLVKDVPTFPPKAEAAMPQGLPFQKEIKPTGLASRYLLKDVKWSLVK